MFKRQIAEAEEKWKSPVLADLENLFAGHWLPSHDISHHQRVWKNACQLLPAFVGELENQPDYFFEELLLACFYHDTGLLVNPGFTHGHESAAWCKKFLSDYRAEIKFNTNELLSAIEHHDDKSYQESSESSLLLKLLSLADDMDAFGAVGAYRYAEIYLLRRMRISEIPDQVLSNAASRFQHLERQLSASVELFYEVLGQYKILQKIYRPDTFPEPVSEMLQMIRDEIIDKRIEPAEYFAGKKSLSQRMIYLIDEYNRL